MKYRVYADGRVVHEDDFAEEDNSLPYYDDYGTYDLPKELEDYFVAEQKEEYAKLEKKFDKLETKFYDLEEEKEDLDRVLEKIQDTIRRY